MKEQKSYERQLSGEEIQKNWAAEDSKKSGSKKIAGAEKHEVSRRMAGSGKQEFLPHHKDVSTELKYIERNKNVSSRRWCTSKHSTVFFLPWRKKSLGMMIKEAIAMKQAATSWELNFIDLNLDKYRVCTTWIDASFLILSAAIYEICLKMNFLRSRSIFQKWNDHLNWASLIYTQALCLSEQQNLSLALAEPQLGHII